MCFIFLLAVLWAYFLIRSCSSWVKFYASVNYLFMSNGSSTFACVLLLPLLSWFLGSMGLTLLIEARLFLVGSLMTILFVFFISFIIITNAYSIQSKRFWVWWKFTESYFAVLSTFYLIFLLHTGWTCERIFESKFDFWRSDRFCRLIRTSRVITVWTELSPRNTFTLGVVLAFCAVNTVTCI